MSIVVNQGGNWVQGSSYIGYDNLALRSDAIVTSNGADAGFPIENATSWLTSGGGWQVTGVGDKTVSVTLDAVQNLNSYGVYKHNLGTLGLTIKLQSSTDGSSWTDIAGTEKTVVNDDAIFVVVSSPTSARYYRVHISGMASGETLVIANLFLGESLNVFSPPEPGWTPPALALDNRYLNSRSEGGDFIGRTLIRKGSKTQFSVGIADADWIRTYWFPFMEAAEEHPFYHAWDTVSYPDEVAYCYTDGKVSIPKYVNSRFMAFDLKFFALIE